MSKILTGVIGHPIDHSKSPLIHNEWIKHYRLDGEYIAHDIAPKNLAAGVRGLIDQGYKGFNVTIPHKEAVMAMCDRLDDTAKEIGAVNTITVKNGKLLGRNTDSYGFAQSITHKYKDFDFKDGKAVMLGAGGAARAVLHALISKGVQHIEISNRTKERAEELVASCIRPNRVKVIDWNQRDKMLDGAHMLINTTSLGMDGQEPLKVYLADMQRNCLIVDLVYSPLHTDLICEAIKYKMPYVLGTGMLLHQARLAFQEWYGVLPGVSPDLEEKLQGTLAA